MLVAAVTFALLQTAPCSSASAALLRGALERVARFEVPGAAEQAAEAGASGCPDARVAARYLEAWRAARDAYRTGGDERSLEPVTKAIADLERESEPGDRHAEVARLVLLAAAAAAQSERGDMALFLEQALTVERLLLAAGQPGAPGVSAHEAAGDLWLQVHRFDAARAAYQRATEMLGKTPRTELGLARVAVQLRDTSAACAAYGSLLRLWNSAPEPVEIHEARTFVDSAECRVGR